MISTEDPINVHLTQWLYQHCKELSLMKGPRMWTLKIPSSREVEIIGITTKLQIGISYLAFRNIKVISLVI